MAEKQKVQYVFVNPNEDGAVAAALCQIIVEKLRSQTGSEAPPPSV